MNVKLRIKFRKWLAIIFVWLCVGRWQSFYDHFTVLSDISSGFSPTYRFSTQLFFNSTAGIIGSILGGSFLIFYIEEKYQEKSYGFTLLLVALSFIFIVSFITVLLGLIFVPVISGFPIGSPEGKEAFIKFISDPVHVKNICLWAIVVSLTQFILQINNKFGNGVLIDFIKGTYRTPRKEERIFMFADLKSSTVIAEKLGDEKYHELLKDFFRDITNPILYNYGQIYQYVGDEVVISWPLDAGLRNNSCLQCYFAMHKKILECSEEYQEKYGLVPSFKAGMHFGSVTAGEIGVIKRDITYSGDVLNTAARIQSMCNELDAKFLVSKSLVKLLTANARFRFESLGAVSLRGKEKNIELCSILLRTGQTNGGHNSG